MKRFLFLASMIFFTSGLARAQEVNYMEEVQSLGAVSGQGLACEASKYHTFELLARAILISKAPSDSVQAQGMKAYNEFKANAFISKLRDGLRDCAEIARAFDNQKIFKATLYGDGTIKMPDGKIIKPRRAYDATLVYKKDSQARQKYIETYQNKIAKIHKDPAFQKALRERQSQENF